MDLSGPVIVTTTLTRSRDLDYVELPLLLRATSPGHGVWTPYVVGGGAVGFLTRATTHWEGPGTHYNTDLGGYDARDWSVVFGIGTMVGERATRAVMEARYTLGLVNVLHDDSGFEARNRELSFSIGLTHVPERDR